MSKFKVTTAGMAPAAKAPSAPKVEPHLMSPAEIAAKIKVYFNAPSKTIPVVTMILGIGGRIVPFAFFTDTVSGVATNRTAQIPEGFEDTEEMRKELEAAYADAYLASPEIQAQVKEHLTARHFRLAEAKKLEADKAVATKLAKANLAVKAETAVAAKVLGDEATA